jgi:hypothetical protein
LPAPLMAPRLLSRGRESTAPFCALMHFKKIRLPENLFLQLLLTQSGKLSQLKE